MVLFCHAPQPYVNQPGQWLIAIDNYYGMAWGPVLFFMISGACIIGKKESAQSFLRRRFSRILLPTFLWSVIYIILQRYVWKIEVDGSIWSQVLMIPFGPQYGLMWFMYALVAIYLCSPIISAWVNQCSKKELEFYLCLWGVTLVLPYLSLICNSFSLIQRENGILFYLSGFLWVAVLGYYCRRYLANLELKRRHFLLGIVVLLSPLWVWVIKRLCGQTVSSSLSIDSIATTALAFMSIMLYNGWKRFRIIEEISKYSFGIYLIHMVFMYPFKNWISRFGLNYALQIPITVIVVGICSFLSVWAISKTKVGNYIVG